MKKGISLVLLMMCLQTVFLGTTEVTGRIPDRTQPIENFACRRSYLCVQYSGQAIENLARQDCNKRAGAFDTETCTAFNRIGSCYFRNDNFQYAIRIYHSFYDEEVYDPELNCLSDEGSWIWD